MTRPTLDELMQPIAAVCGRCGCTHAQIVADRLPDPLPKGYAPTSRLICPRCNYGVKHTG